jgi:asparagine synthetase B (glutamine-hydrolysing)
MTDPEIKLVPPPVKPPVRAVYRLRENGDYDFVAAFANDDDLWDGDVAETYAENLRSEGEEILVKNFDDLAHLVDVLIPHAGMPNAELSDSRPDNQ